MDWRTRFNNCAENLRYAAQETGIFLKERVEDAVTAYKAPRDIFPLGARIFDAGLMLGGAFCCAAGIAFADPQGPAAGVMAFFMSSNLHAGVCDDMERASGEGLSWAAKERTAQERRTEHRIRLGQLERTADGILMRPGPL